MKSSAAHYDSHLGPVYAWMLGDLDAAFGRAEAELNDVYLPHEPGALAVDLGAGLGLHSVALARQGFRVLAIDSCALLLEELKRRTVGMSVTAIEGDLTDFPRYTGGKVDAILCMGDTLTHLPSLQSVELLLDRAAASLGAQGVFVATFRDYVSRELQGDERFILVRRDNERVLTCFLEYGEGVVTVHDILTERKDGEWVQTVSSYPKLRLAPEWLIERLQARGLSARRETAPAGMVRIYARR